MAFVCQDGNKLMEINCKNNEHTKQLTQKFLQIKQNLFFSGNAWLIALGVVVLYDHRGKTL